MTSSLRAGCSLLFGCFLAACNLAGSVPAGGAEAGRALAVATASPAASPTRPASPTPTILPSQEQPSPTWTAPVRETQIQPTSPVSSLCTPLEGYDFSELPEITSRGFLAPRPGKDDGHHGIDFAHWTYRDRETLEGVAIQSVLPGTVAAAVTDGWPYGNMVIIETGYSQIPAGVSAKFAFPESHSLYLLYAHMLAPPAVDLGEPVACGQAIGIVGNTGNSGNPHLHLETRTGPPDEAFAGMVYYTTLSSEEERQNYARWRFGGEFIPLDPMLLLAVDE